MQQEVTIICQSGLLHTLTNALDREFGILETLKDRGHSTKMQQGYLTLEWDGEIDPEFESYLQADERVLDYYVAPRILPSEASISVAVA